MLVTGYYEPLFHGSPQKAPPYIYPIYSVPPSLITRTENGKKIIGQNSPEGHFVDFWTRREIETKNLLAGYELAYLRDPFDAFLLHVQGSGRLQFPDGSLHAVGFAGSNGLEYMSIGKLLVEQQKMDLEDVNVPAIRQYLNEHPHERTDILHHNPRYIFFTWSNSEGPKGSSQCVLTPGRSVAIDNSALPSGTIGYLESRKPVLNRQNEIIAWEKFGRFVCPQDTGSAIKGTGRIDIFWGNGDYAEIAASHMKEDGALYFLVAKD